MRKQFEKLFETTKLGIGIASLRTTAWLDSVFCWFDEIHYNRQMSFCYGEDCYVVSYKHYRSVLAHTLKLNVLEVKQFKQRLYLFTKANCSPNYIPINLLHLKIGWGNSQITQFLSEGFRLTSKTLHFISPGFFILKSMFLFMLSRDWLLFLEMSLNYQSSGFLKCL